MEEEIMAQRINKVWNVYCFEDGKNFFYQIHKGLVEHKKGDLFYLDGTENKDKESPSYVREGKYKIKRIQFQSKPPERTLGKYHILKRVKKTLLSKLTDKIRKNN